MKLSDFAVSVHTSMKPVLLLVLLLLMFFMLPLVFGSNCVLDKLQVSWRTEGMVYNDPPVLPNQYVDFVVLTHVSCYENQQNLIGYPTPPLFAPPALSIFENGEQFSSTAPLIPQNYSSIPMLLFSPGQPQLWNVTVELSAYGNTLSQKLGINVTNSAPW